MIRYTGCFGSSTPDLLLPAGINGGLPGWGMPRFTSNPVLWNITGRYLGFKLPSGTYLSKKNHEPFLRMDYEQLNTFLADSFSNLANFPIYF